jgi:hypothetical protein
LGSIGRGLGHNSIALENSVLGILMRRIDSKPPPKFEPISHPFSFHPSFRTTEYIPIYFSSQDVETCFGTQHVCLNVTFTVTQQPALDTSKSVQHYRTAISSTCTGIFRPPWLCHHPSRQGNAIKGVHVTYRCQHRAPVIRTLTVLEMQRNLPASTSRTC